MTEPREHHSSDIFMRAAIAPLGRCQVAEASMLFADREYALDRATWPYAAD